jgi:hypothetical protein
VSNRGLEGRMVQRVLAVQEERVEPAGEPEELDWLSTDHFGNYIGPVTRGLRMDLRKFDLRIFFQDSRPDNACRYHCNPAKRLFRDLSTRRRCRHGRRSRHGLQGALAERTVLLLQVQWVSREGSISGSSRTSPRPWCASNGDPLPSGNSRKAPEGLFSGTCFFSFKAAT